MIAQIKKDDISGKFGERIDYLRFPYFKNLAEGCRINFSSPFTIFVGPNGCGKSSVLQALYGSPKGYSLSEFWFSTRVDPIVDKNTNDRHCFIYSYGNSGPDKEVLKRRSFKKDQPDLFDTSPAIKAYNMANPDKRTLKPIEKNVVYLNFRTAQNAFEKVFHEERPPKRGIQDFIRSRNIGLYKAFNYPNGFQDARYTATHDPVIDMPSDQVEAASQILGREYLSARIVRHHLYRRWGKSIMMTTSSASYSEAFAGSGEFAVFLLVHEIMSASPRSLLLLDEPETSLHPGAQKKLQQFLLQQCFRKKHQVIICSHSPFLVEGLPAESIKVFGETADGKFDVYDAVNTKEVFNRIGFRSNCTKIFVEDRLGKLLLEAVIRSVDSSLLDIIEVSFPPGGKNQIMQDLTVFSRASDDDVFVVFDSDVKPTEPFADPSTSINADIFNNPQACVSQLTEDLKSRGFCPKFPRDGGTDDLRPLENQRDDMMNYIKKCRTDVFYFPFDLEEMIWDDDLAKSILDNGEEITLNDLDGLNRKKLYFELAQSGSTLPSLNGNQIDLIHGFFIKKWLNQQGEGHEECLKIVNKIRESI